MPYAEPTSPIPSPRKEHPQSSRKGWMSPPIDNESVPSSGPMPGIPRRSSSATSTPRRGLSPSASRAPSTSTVPSIDGLPRTSGVSDSLGLRLHSSPSKAPITSRGSRSSNSPSSTVEEPTPQTPDSLSFYDPASSSSSRIRRRPTLLHSHSATQGHHRGGPSGGSLQINLAASSSPNLEATSSSQDLRPSTSMIRKKSGEVVKPSLKQRSMSTPDLTRRQSDGSDEGDGVDATTASARDLQDHAAKSVRFAGGDGEEGGLESVVLFLREQKVTAVSRAADQDGAVQTETETENDTDASDFVQFRTRRNAAARATDEAITDIEINMTTPIPRKRVDFGPDAKDALQNEHVILERIDLQSNLALHLRGTILVRNVSYQKWIAVRFTLDQWQTVSEVSGTHVNHIPSSTTGDEGWDRFAFTIKLEDYRRKIDERELSLCIRYSVHGQDWWDSNEGRNYKFSFKKVPARRFTPRGCGSGAANFGGGFLRLTDDSTNMPTLRAGRNGATPRIGGGARPWVFPTKSSLERADSPVPSPPPPASFRAPAPPDVHTHLNLSKWCAPSSPPQSPPKDKTQPFALNTLSHSAPVKPATTTEMTKDMTLVNGQYATISPPSVRSGSLPTQPSVTVGETKKAITPLSVAAAASSPIAPSSTASYISSSSPHIRNKSWSAESSGSSAESTGTAVADIVDLEDTNSTPRDGELTPTADHSRSPEESPSPDNQNQSSPDAPLTMKRSTGNLRALVEGSSEIGLFTPPASNLPSPPFPSRNGLPPVPMSPSPSASTDSVASTGESSPVTVGSENSVQDLVNFDISDISVDPEHARTLNANSYQDFLRKFCFFESPIPMTQSLDPHEIVYRKPNYIPLSGYSSPTTGTGFPFYSHSSNSPRSTPTPTRQFETANEAFGFGGTTPVLANSPQFPSTPKPSPPNEMVAAATQKSSKWQHDRSSSSLAARS